MGITGDSSTENLMSHHGEDFASIIGRLMHCSQKSNGQTRVKAVYHFIRCQKSMKCFPSWEAQQFSPP